MKSINIIGIEGMPDICPGDDLTNLIIDACNKEGISIENGDILV
jgi:F420-0:gamma-glutamyl ligase